MTRKEFYDALSVRMPQSLSEEWDNDGEMCLPDLTRPVKKVLCTLDVGDAVVSRAIEEGYDLILSHHPLIFGGLRAVQPNDPVSRRVISLVQNDIAVFSFHTRLDAAEGGINDALANLLGLAHVEPLDGGLGRVGELPSPLSMHDFAEKVKCALGAPGLNILCKQDTVSRVAVVGGEGKDFIAAAKASGADTYLSGRLGYHAMIDGAINLVECGHYFTERHAAELLADMAKDIDRSVQADFYAPNLLSVY